MKKALLTVLSIVCIVAVPMMAQTAATSLPAVPVVEHYGLVFRVDPEHHMLSADADLIIRNSSDAAVTAVPVLLYRLMDVEAAADGQGKPLAFEQKVVKYADDPAWQVNYIQVKLPAPLAPRQAQTIHLKYSGQLFGYREGWPYVRDTISEEYSLFRSETLCYPTVAGPSQASRRQSVRSKFDYEIDTVVPEGFIARCGGKDTGEPKTRDGHSTFHCVGEPNSSFLTVAVAKFKAFVDPERNLRVYAMPADAGDGDRIMGEMRRSLDLYRSYLGEVQGGSLTLIEIPDGWGSYATSGHIFQSAAAFKDKERANELWHEVSHRWTNTCSFRSCSPRVQRTRYFDEAFATYFEALGVREFQGEEAFRKYMEQTREYFTERATKDPRGRSTAIADYGREELGGFSYSKGAWSLYVLRQLLGEDAFRRSVAGFLKEYNGKAVEFEDFRRSLEKSSGRDLGGWYQQWLASGEESSAMLIGGKTVEEMAAKCRASGRGD